MSVFVHVLSTKPRYPMLSIPVGLPRVLEYYSSSKLLQ